MPEARPPAPDGALRLLALPRLLPLLTAGWLLVGVNSWGSFVVFHVTRHKPLDYAHMTAYVLARALLWMVLTLIVFAFLDRQPPGRMTVREALFIVLPFLLLMTLCDLVAKVVIMNLTWPWYPRKTFAEAFFTILPNDFHTTLLWIFMIIAVGHGIRLHYAAAYNRLRESQLETALARAQVQTLSSRIEPHFVFNALNSISALLHVDAAAAERMIGRLGDLLSAAMTAGDSDVVPLADELLVVRQYLAIQQIRFADRMTIEIAADDDVVQLPVPRFVLQPLVENAVRHGIEGLDHPGVVFVGARRIGARLVLTVHNDAPPDAMLDERPEGIGLSNTRARLALLYGAAHRFEIRKRDDGAVEATVEIPIAA